jgi:hypothetical protein
MPFPAFALLGTPHTGVPPRIVRVRVKEIYDWLGVVACSETDVNGRDTGLFNSHVLPLYRIASLKTLAAKVAAFSAPASRPPFPNGRDEGCRRGNTNQT